MSEFCVLLPVYGTSHLMQPMLDSLEQNEILYSVYCDGDAKASLQLNVQANSWEFGSYGQKAHNRGLLAARRDAWEQFKNEVPQQGTVSHVLNFDSDDTIPKNSFQWISKGCAKDVDVVEFNAYVSSGPQSQMLYRGLYNSYLKHYGPLEAFLERRMRFSIWAKLVRRSLWESICEELEQLCGDLPHLVNGEDIVWTWMLASRARSWRFVNHPIYNYCIHAHSASNSICMTKVRKKFDDILAAHDIIRRDLQRQPPFIADNIEPRLDLMRLANLRHTVLPSFSILNAQQQNEMFTPQERDMLQQASNLPAPSYLRYARSLIRETKAVGAALFR